MPLDELNAASLLFLAALIHLLEEFVIPGGFAGEFRAMLSGINLKVTNEWLIATNTLFWVAVALAQVSESAFFCFTTVSIAFINGLLHVGKSIHVRRYFPGLISAALLYIPLGILSIVRVELTPGRKVLGILCGMALHAFPLIMLVIFSKRRGHN